MDAIFDLAQNIVNTRYEDLSREVIDIAKKFIIDTIGVGIAGSAAAGNQAIMDLVGEWGGKEESTVMVYGLRVPAPEAAFANSILIHSPDYDDTDDRTATHANVTSFPAALALAEKTGGGGKSLIAAAVLGVDLTCRLALTANLFHGWHNTPIAGVFGAAAAAGKLLGLDRAGMVNALGIAYSQAAGNRQGRADGALTKRLQPAFMAKAGMVSALLARSGVTGAQNVVQGEWGFFRLYHDYSVEYSPERWAKALTDGLGIRFEAANLSIKPYPCVRCAHAPIDGALSLAEQYDLKPGDIDEVVVNTNQIVLETAGKPFVIRTNPVVDAQFSIPYVVAVALTRRRVVLDDFEEKIVRDPTLVELADRVRVIVPPEFEDSRSVVGPVKVEVRTKTGMELSCTTGLAKGHPKNPMSDAETTRKFQDCVAHSARLIPERNIEQLLDRLHRLEKVEYIGEVVRLLV